MDIIKVTSENESMVLAYMQKLQGLVPYYFSTSSDILKEYLLHDTLRGQEIMDTNNLYMAIEDGVCHGLIQYGIQAVDFNEKGEFIAGPNTGNIRHLFYDVDSEAGEVLIQEALRYFDEIGIKEIYAFNHVAGLSCYSKHGKLHESMDHVHQLLEANGFSTRHANIYYVLDINNSDSMSEVRGHLKQSLVLEIEQGDDRDYIKLFDLEHNQQLIGVSEVTRLSLWSKDVSDDKLYMRYIHINKDFQGRGYSKGLIAKICEIYSNQGIKFIHTDTSLYNKVAQNLYNKLGFEHHGITRDYKVLMD